MSRRALHATHIQTLTRDYEVCSPVRWGNIANTQSHLSTTKINILCVLCNCCSGELYDEICTCGVPEADGGEHTW